MKRSMYRADLSLLQMARSRMLELTSGVSQKHADYSPADGEWSIGEILDHVLLSEAINRETIAELIELAKRGKPAFINRTAAEFNVSPAFLPKFLAPFAEVPFRVLNALLPAVVRETMVRYRLITFRNADIAEPRKRRLIGQLRTDLEQSIRETTRLLEANPDLDYRNMIFDHPVLGRNNVLQLLRILAFHELRHQDQITNIFHTAGYTAAIPLPVRT